MRVSESKPAAVAMAPRFPDVAHPQGGTIHIEFRQAQVRIEGSADPALVRVLLECLRAMIALPAKHADLDCGGRDRLAAWLHRAECVGADASWSRVRSRARVCVSRTTGRSDQSSVV